MCASIPPGADATGLASLRRKIDTPGFCLSLPALTRPGSPGDNRVSRERPFGCAIVGVGMIAGFHARALAEVPNARLLALVSRRPDRARDLAASQGFSCDVYPELAPVLAR